MPNILSCRSWLLSQAENCIWKAQKASFKYAWQCSLQRRSRALRVEKAVQNQETGKKLRLKMTLQHLGAVRVIVLRDSQHKQPLNKAEKTATAPRQQASRCRFQLLNCE